MVDYRPWSPVRRAGCGAAGMTLLDITLALLVMAVLSMIAVPAMGPVLSDDTLRGATAEVVAAIEYALGLAVLYQRPFFIDTDAVGERFQVRDSRANPPHAADPQTDNNGAVFNPLDKKWYLVDFWNWERYRGVDIDDSITLKLFPDGHSSENDTTLTLTYKGASKTITVNGFTGKVTVN